MSVSYVSLLVLCNTDSSADGVKWSGGGTPGGALTMLIDLTIAASEMVKTFAIARNNYLHLAWAKALLSIDLTETAILWPIEVITLVNSEV